MNAAATAVTVLPQHGSNRALTAVEVRQHVNLIQEVMRSVMKEGVHYGIIPGCKQPSLYKAGSEVLLTTFRIAVSVVVEDLSSDDMIRYRVHTIGTHQPTGVVVGEGIGECSSNETKYKWRRCYLRQEFDATPETRRRIKYAEGKNGKVYENMEVRTDPADLANTVLKMAKKRAQVDMTLTATGASDVFAQDIEDIPEELLDAHEDRRAPRQPPQQQQTSQPYPTADFDRNLAGWLAVIESGRKTADEIIAMVESKGTLTDAQKESIRGTPAKAQPIEGEVVDPEPSA